MSKGAVLTTGANSGIGRATALKVAEAGAHVIIVARDLAKLDAAAAEIRSRGGTVSRGSRRVRAPFL